MLNITKTSDLVSTQLPDFYSEEGDTFVEFLKVYYKWMEECGYDRSSTDLLSILDIDETEDKFLDHFRETYMKGVPQAILGNQRLLQKHILDLYRSKGSIEGLKLLFRLLYNEDIQVYIPSYDVFKSSDGKWIERRYIEASLSDLNRTYENKRIIGSSSGATAFVEVYERRVLTPDQSKPNLRVETDILFINDVTGKFLVGEQIFTEGTVDISNAPVIRGSVESIDILYSNPGFSIGDVIRDIKDPEVKYRVTDLKSSGTGIINGTFQTNPNTYMAYGYTNIDNIKLVVHQANTNPGVNYSFEPLFLPSGEFMTVITEPLAAYANTSLGSSDYNMPGPGNENINSVIGTSLNTETFELQFITGIRDTNPGTGYNDSITIDIIDKVIAPYNITLPDRDNLQLGNSAFVAGTVSVGVNQIRTAKVVNSSFNAKDGAAVNLSDDPYELSPITKAKGIVHLGPIGKEQGFYHGTDGFISADKYLQDSYYYQEYSYDIQSSKPLERYFNILKRIAHPSGNEVFGTAVISSTKKLNGSVDNFRIQQG